MIKLVIFDFDGVFTDNKIIFDTNGNAMKHYNTQDGTGIFKLHELGFETGVISGWKKNISQEAILKHLKIKRVSLGTKNKLKILNKWCNELNITLDEVAYMGDDLNDIMIMKKVKLVACPNNSINEVKLISDLICEKKGGDGAVREFCDYIIDNYKIKEKKYNFKQGKITAIVAVRKGSVRCKNKNIKPIGDSNLLTLKLKILKSIDTIDEIILTTDCEISKLIGKHMNIKIDNRPDYYCSDECDGSTMLHYIANICSTEHILYSPVTSPFFSANFLREAISKYKSLDNDYHDCIITKNKIKDFIWNNKNPINYKISDFPRSQDLTNDIFTLNFGCCLLPKEIMMKQKYIVGKNPLFIYNNEKYNEIDVDTPLDFAMTEKIYNTFFKEDKKTKFIDVTIRDGGFSNNWNWSYEEVKKYYNLCVSLKYKYFEIGYFIDKNLKEINSGIWRNLPHDILNNFPKKKECKISAMIDHWKYNIQNLKPRNITNIDLIRVTTYKENVRECMVYCKKIKNLGYEVSLNLIVCSWLNNDELLNIILEILKNDNFLDFICIADSYGNMNPEKTMNIITTLSSYLNCLNVPLGFHIHDTAGLGFSNAIQSLKMGIEYLDTSLFGIGRGVGNLSCNNILLYLNSKGKIENNIIMQLLEFIDSTYPEKRKDIEKVLQGFYNIHPISFLKIKNDLSVTETYNKMLKLTNKEKYHYSNLN